MITKLVAIFISPQMLQRVETFLVSKPAYINAGTIDEYAIWPRNGLPIMWNMLFVAAPQSGTTITLLMGTGFALLILGALILLEKKVGFILKPFSEVGQVVLTLYVFQFIIVWLFEILKIPYSFGDFIFGDIAVFTIVTMIGVSVSKLPFGWIKGLMRRIEQKVS